MLGAKIGARFKAAVATESRMNIRFIETVVCLAQLRSFRATAEQMGITPAAISSRILAIENEFGIRLFDRDSKEVRITPDGEEFLSGALKIVGDYRSLVQTLAKTGGTQGRISLGVVPTVAPSLLPRIIGRLKTDYPRLIVSVVTDSGRRLLEMLDNSDLDLILSVRNDGSPGRREAPLWTLGMYWVAQTGIFPSGAKLGIQDLISQPIISYEKSSLNGQRILDYLGAASQEEYVIHYSNSLATTINLVEAGVGISVLPLIAVQEQLRDGTLTALDVQPRFPSTDYYILWLQASNSQMHRLVAEVACNTAKEIASEYSRDLVILPE